MRKVLSCSRLPLPDMPGVQGVQVNDWVFISGLNGLAETGVPTTFAQQAALVMERLRLVTAQADMEMEELVKCNVYLQERAQLAVFEEIYARYFSDGAFPARYVFTMPSLLGPQEIMIEAVGRKTPRDGERPQRVTLPSLPLPGASCHAVRTGHFIFTSAIPPAGSTATAPRLGFEDQIRSAVEHMIEAVEAAGGAKESIVKVVVFLKNLDEFDHFNVIYRTYFNKNNNPPARSCFGVTAFDGDYEVALECVAYVGDDRQTLCSPEVPSYDLPFCQGIRAEDMVFISGQVGCDRRLGGMPESFDGQMDAIFHNMISVAREAGAGPEDIVRTTGYLVNADDYGRYKRLYRRHWGETLPAATVFGVSGISYDYALEIDSHACLSREA